MSLFDPHVSYWRSVGLLTVKDTATFEAGDPCYGSFTTLRDVTLTAGEYEWFIRDADEAGEKKYTPAEVRLVKVGATGVVDSWNWWNEYGEANEDGLLPDGLGSVAAIGSRGVDAGVMGFYVRPMGWTHDKDFDHDDVLYLYSDGEPRLDNHLLAMTSGYGDGCYPLAARAVNGEVVEVRMQFIPEPDPALTVAEFTALLPGVFAGAKDTRERDAFFEANDEARKAGEPFVEWEDLLAAAPEPTDAIIHGQVVLHVHRTAYRSPRKYRHEEGYDPNDLEESVYDTVYGVLLPDSDFRFSRVRFLSTDDEPEAMLGLYLLGEHTPVDRFAQLWNRLSDEDKAGLVTSEETLSVTQREPVGAIVDGTETDLIVRLNVTIPAAAPVAG